MYVWTKALKMTTVGGQHIGTIVRKSMTLFMVSTSDGQELFMLELPDIFASQWSNIRAMTVTVRHITHLVKNSFLSTKEDSLFLKIERDVYR
jgi:hypothetical protein